VEWQHSEVEDATRDLSLLAGSEEETISTKSLSNAGLPICGDLSDVAPRGAQSVNPSAQASPAWL
jgi:hypothetical protein